MASSPAVLYTTVSMAAWAWVRTGAAAGAAWSLAGKAAMTRMDRASGTSPSDHRTSSKPAARMRPRQCGASARACVRPSAKAHQPSNRPNVMSSQNICSVHSMSARAPSGRSIRRRWCSETSRSRVAWMQLLDTMQWNAPSCSAGTGFSTSSSSNRMSSAPPNCLRAAATSDAEMSVYVYSNGSPRERSSFTRCLVVPPVPAPTSRMRNLPEPVALDSAFTMKSPRSSVVARRSGQNSYISSMIFFVLRSPKMIWIPSFAPARQAAICDPVTRTNLSTLACCG